MKLNSTRKGYYEVHVDGKKQSKHTSVTEVIAKGFELKSNNLGAEVRIKQPDLLIDVELSDSINELEDKIRELEEKEQIYLEIIENLENCVDETTEEEEEEVEEEVEEAPPVGLKAFPTAIGAGANATGGRGGKICYVDTLTWDTAIVYDASTDSYSGGFYNMFYELDIPAKQIVFEVAGTIVVPNYTVLNFANKTYSGNITISGQTAPGKIVFSTAYWSISNCSNLIVRYIDFYKRDEVPGADTLWVVADDASNVIDNIIFDHCSFFYGQDECLSITNSGTGLLDKVTVQNTLMAASSKGSIIGSYNGICDATTAYCAYVDVSYRFPNMLCMGESRQDAINIFVENNTSRLIRTTGSGKFNVQNMYVQSNRASYGRNKLQYQTQYGNPTLHSSGTIITNGAKETPTSPDFDVWSIFAASDLPEYSPIPAEFRRDTPFDLVGQPFTIYPTEQIKDIVLPNVGNIKRVGENGEVIADSYPLTSYYIDRAINQVPTDEQQNYPAERYPSIASSAGYVSTLKDGIPDVWRAANMSGENHNDIAPSGYTWLENYLNSVD